MDSHVQFVEIELTVRFIREELIITSGLSFRPGNETAWKSGDEAAGEAGCYYPCRQTVHVDQRYEASSSKTLNSRLLTGSSTVV